jgi:hypothetical protein
MDGANDNDTQGNPQAPDALPRYTAADATADGAQPATPQNDKPTEPVNELEMHQLADGRSFAVPTLPVPAFAHAEQYVAPVRATIASLQEFTEKAHAIANDRMLSDEGRAHRLAPAAAEAISGLVKQHETLGKRADAIDAQRAALFELPELRPNDSVAELRDQEARMYWRGLSADERAELLPALAGGKHPKLAAALMRSPWPVPGATAAVQGWNAHIEHEHQGELIDLQGQREMLDWARDIVRRAAEKLTETKGVSPGLVGGVLAKQQGADAGPFKVAHKARG